LLREQFYALCENQHPQTGNQLTLRQNATDERRVFFDFTCSAPKSVSILAVTMNDQRLIATHEEAAKAAFREAGDEPTEVGDDI
jgi:conjugative relaxase-like TrwC/TraI family protein